jgi:phage virion morphogenesis protein
MSIQIRNNISPELALRAALVRNKRPILEAMGAEFVSITKRNFVDASMRPAPWAPLKPATIARKKGRGGILRDHGPLLQSIRVTEVTNDSVTSGSDRPYAAIQQLGGKAGRGLKATIPPRPYFPILNGKLTPLAQERIEAVGRAKIRSLLK